MLQARKAWPSNASLWQGSAILLTFAGAAYQLRGQGRAWLCSCGYLLIWSGDVWSAGNSQHISDPYSFTHLLHGFLFCGALAAVAPGLAWGWRLWLALFLEAAWEAFENTDFVIGKYREATAAIGYQGDTIVNSLGDIAACGAGFVLASYLGLKRSVVVFVVIEAALLLFIRDSLLLNIVMLIYPIEEIKEWQIG